MPGGHVRLSVEPRSSSADVSADGTGVWRATELYSRRGRAVVWTEDVWRWSVPVSERRLYSRALGLWSRQWLRGLLWWTVQLQYVPPDFSVYSIYMCQLHINKGSSEHWKSFKQVWMHYRSGTAERWRMMLHRRPADAVCVCMKWHLGSHVESRNLDSVDRCAFTWRTILQTFIPVRFEMTASLRLQLLWRWSRPTTKKQEPQDE